MGAGVRAGAVASQRRRWQGGAGCACAAVCGLVRNRAWPEREQEGQDIEDHGATSMVSNAQVLHLPNRCLYILYSPGTPFESQKVVGIWLASEVGYDRLSDGRHVAIPRQT